MTIIAPVGLKNYHNSCYLNAILQTLICCQKFNETLKKTTKWHKKHQLPICTLYNAIYDIFTQNVHENNHATHSLLNQLVCQLRSNCLVIRTKEQQDAYEVLLLILKKIHQEIMNKGSCIYHFPIFFDRIQYIQGQDFFGPITVQYFQKEYENMYKNDYSCISLYFSIQILKIIECNHCKEKSLKIESNDALILPISSKNINSINDALISYFLPENVSNNILCNKCNQNDKNIKIHTYLLGLPIYLIIVLNRFNFDKNTLKCAKNGKLIYFEEILKIQPFMLNTDKNVQYSLQSTINHTGNMNHGHYYSFQKYNHIWYKCNDEIIEKVPDNIMPLNDKKNVYLLLYRLQIE